ncbi:MAG: hypothetical protein KDG55_19895 [Rhodocyclaceae bacterium]|nr:hypothetical protein [Rhodocyclaceae bacterium]
MTDPVLLVYSLGWRSLLNVGVYLLSVGAIIVRCRHSRVADRGRVVGMSSLARLTIVGALLPPTG